MTSRILQHALRKDGIRLVHGFSMHDQESKITIPSTGNWQVAAICLINNKHISIVSLLKQNNFQEELVREMQSRFTNATKKTRQKLL